VSEPFHGGGDLAQGGSLLPKGASRPGSSKSIANLYFLRYGLAIKARAGPEFWTAIAQNASAFEGLTIGNALHNIIVATVGNPVGGSLMVGGVYWFVYLRRRDSR
jgi:formate transporter